MLFCGMKWYRDQVLASVVWLWGSGLSSDSLPLFIPFHTEKTKSNTNNESKQNLVDQERPEASHLQYNPCLQCSLQFCCTSVFPSHKEELFSHVPLFFWWMYSDIWSSCQEIYRDVFFIMMLFSIDGFFSFCTHLCTHISNINMHT